MALLAIEHQALVVVGVARRIGPGFFYEIRCEEVIDPASLTGTADDVRLLTQQFVGPGTTHHSRPNAVSVAASPLEASAAGQKGRGFDQSDGRLARIFHPPSRNG